MDGCTTFHHGPQTRLRKLRLRLVELFLTQFVYLLNRIKPGLKPAFTILFFSFLSFTASASVQVATVTATDAQIELARKQINTMTLQIVFPTVMFDQDNIFSSVLKELPKHFAGLKLNTIGRGLHSSLLYLDSASFEDVRKVINFFSRLDRATLEAYDLIRPVQVVDLEHLHFKVIGTKSKFLGLEPHPEFIAWQLRFLKMVKEIAPELFAIHMRHGNLAAGHDPFSTEGVHISLLQWGERFGLAMSDAEVKQMISTLTQLFVFHGDRIHRETGRKADIIYDLSKNPIQFSLPPVSLMNSAISIASFRLSGEGKPNLSTVGRWQYTDPKSGFRSSIEFDVKRLAAGEQDVFFRSEDAVSSFKKDWLSTSAETPLSGDPLSPKFDFKKNIQTLSVNMKRVLENILASDQNVKLSPTKYPKAAGSQMAERAQQFFTTELTHPKLAPEKGFDALVKARSIGFSSTHDVSVGLGLYASSVRADVENPGDLDMIVNSIVHVPSSVQSLSEAEDYAIDAFIRDVFGNLIRSSQSGKISIIEMRLGSDSNLKIPVKDFMSGLEENPYLSFEDFVNGYFKHSSGKTFSIREMVKAGDFMKGKIDLYTPNGRIEVSLQFLTGYEWKGSIYTYQCDGIKGIPPLVRTAVYDGFESYAVAAALSRTFDYYNTQKGSFIARGIRDLIKSNSPLSVEPVWNSKFIKKFYNFLILLRNGGMGLDEIFTAETKQLLLKELPQITDYQLDQLVERIVVSINQPHLKTFNAFKRNVNDYREFNERQQVFDPAQWEERRVETLKLIEQMTSLQESGEIVFPTEFEKYFNLFKYYFNRAEKMTTTREAAAFFRGQNVYPILLGLEKEITKLDGYQIGFGHTPASLLEQDRIFIKTFIGYLPHFFHRYIQAREQEADHKMEWNLRFMGIAPTQKNLELMQFLSKNMNSMDRAEFAEIQKNLFSEAHTVKCSELLTKPESN